MFPKFRCLVNHKDSGAKRPGRLSKLRIWEDFVSRPLHPDLQKQPSVSQIAEFLCICMSESEREPYRLKGRYKCRDLTEGP
jgi:hypothetical protein